MEIRIIKTDDSHDSNDVRFFKDGVQIGYGYQSKDDLKIHIVRCPKCDIENYSLAKAEGSCFNCGFDPNIEQPKGGEYAITN